MIDPRALKATTTTGRQDMAGHYCKHCYERIKLRDGTWVRVMQNPYQNSYDCSASADGHTPR